MGLGQGEKGSVPAEACAKGTSAERLQIVRRQASPDPAELCINADDFTGDPSARFAGSSRWTRHRSSIIEKKSLPSLMLRQSWSANCTPPSVKKE
jgi:hypothetical protein